MKKSRLVTASLSAAVAAVLLGGQSVHAQTVTWDATGAIPPTDGGGNWDTVSNNWYNGTAAVPWSNAAPYSALLGTGSNPNAGGSGNYVLLDAPNIIVQDLIFGTAAGGGYYNLADQTDGGETLTLAGNLIKSSAVGTSIIGLTSQMVLTAGNHVVAINDTPGPVPELAVDNPITGSGSITMNNAFNSSGYQQWGTFVVNVDNSYSGGTNIVDGIITDNSNSGLGTGTVTISNQGALEFGGNGTTQPATMNITEPIVIQRNTYTGNNFSDYPDAIISSNTGNSGNTVTINGPFVVDSIDARVAANTSTLVIASALQQGPDVSATNSGVLTLDGDFAGYVNLTANNTGWGGTIRMIGGVELNVTNLNQIGGPTGNLTMNGGTIHPVAGVFTSFGTLNVNYSTFNGGVDIDPNQSFTISQNLGASGNTNGSIGERGAGTLTLSGTDSLGGSTFWDGWSAAPEGGGVKGGVINVTGTVALGSLHLRSPSVNVTGTLLLNDPAGGEFNSFGVDSTGTFGGPDEAVVNISGDGIVDETTGDDFNISDNANTQGTINISGNGQFITGGITWLGKSAGGVGTINQNGGSVTINRGGNFGFVLGDGRFNNGSPTGYYNLNSGTFTDENGEIYVGEGNGGNPGIGYWTQTGGTATFGNWFVVGREGAKGTVLISGGSLTKDTSNGGANVSIGEGGANVCTFTVDNTGVFNDEIGQMFVGNNSSVGIMNVGSPTDPVNAAPSVTVNDWFAIGRNGSSVGTLNLYDGSVTQQTQNFFDIGGDGGSAQGTVNVFGGTLTALNTWIGENGGCVGILNMSGGNASLGTVLMARFDSSNGTINLNGGTLSAIQINARDGGSSGTGKLFLNGGTLTSSASNSDYIDARVDSVVSTGGAIVNPGGNSLTINSALTHDSTLAGADGGLTVNGAGTVLITGADTYSGGTKVTAGTLVVGANGALPSGTAVSITNGTLQLGTSTGLATISKLAIAGNGTFDVNNDHVILNYGAGPDPVASIAALLATGYNGGTWNGAGGIGSSAAAVTPGYGVGYADALDTGNPANLSAGTIELKYTLLGDANLDGVVNAVDFGILAANFNKGVSRWDQGDFNYDNVVSAVDFAALATNFNKGASGTSIGLPAYDDPQILAFAAANNLLADVPEPASISLLAVGGLAVMRRRRRNA